MHTTQEITVLSKYLVTRSLALLLNIQQSRHTFGTLLVSAGVPMESIAKMMGHTNIRTTQGYAKVTDDKISEDMDRLIEKRGQQQLTNNNASV